MTARPQADVPYLRRRIALDLNNRVVSKLRHEPVSTGPRVDAHDSVDIDLCSSDSEL
jgi:hypothetical protein